MRRTALDAHLPTLLSRLRGGQMGRRDFLTTATALGATGALAAGLAGLPGPRPARAQEGPPGATVRCQMRVFPLGDPRLFDWSEKGNVARGFLENLVRYSDGFTLEPWLLEGWEVSDDARTVTLRLRPGVTWSNGDAFEAADVVFNLSRWADALVPGNSMATRMAALVDPATGQAADGAIEVVDPLTVRLHLRAPDITLIPGLADYPALLVHRGFEAAGGDLAAAPVGTGPYALSELIPGERAVLTRRGGWWGGEVALERIEYLDLGTDPADFLAAFRAGVIDVVYDSTPAYLPLYEELGLARTDILSGATLVARVNRNHGPPGLYSDVRIRRALQLAVDNAVILELGYNGEGLLAANHHVAPMQPDYVEIGPAEADTSTALRLVRGSRAEEVEHELISVDDDWNRATADAIAAQLRDAGLRVRRRIMNPAVFWPGWQTHPFSCTEWNMRPLGVQVMALAYTSGGAWNETGFADPGFDAAVAAAVAEPDPLARVPHMELMVRTLRGDGAIIQPFWRRLFAHHRPGIEGMRRHPMNEHHHDLWSLGPGFSR